MNTEAEPEAWPAIVIHSGHPAFFVAFDKTKAALGLGLNVLLALGSLGVLLVAHAPVMALDVLFFSYLAFTTAQTLRSESGLYLTHERLVVLDGGGSLGATWAAINSATARKKGTRVVAIELAIPNGLLRAQGGAAAWRPVNRALGKPLVLHPARYVKGTALSDLVEWCRQPEHHQLIGHQTGRERFLSSVRA